METTRQSRSGPQDLPPPPAGRSPGVADPLEVLWCLKNALYHYRSLRSEGLCSPRVTGLLQLILSKCWLIM